MTLTINFRAFARVLAVCAAALAGCEPSGGGDAGGRAVVFDHRAQDVLGADLESVNGTYGANCTNRSGSWSLEIASGATLDHTALSVVRNDTACVLTLTELRLTGGSVLSATPAIELGTGFQASASSFGSPVAFYANAKLSSVGFGGDFALTLLFADDASLASGDRTATFAVQTATVSAQSVDAPDYTIDVTGLSLQTDIDDVVQTASGSVALSAGTVSGTHYAVVDAADLDTYDEVDAAYLGATSAAFATPISAAAFSLVGDDLTTAQVRTLIVANVSNGVRSYQVFEITFNAPVRI